MTQMNLSAKEKQSHRHREQTWGCQGGGKGEAGYVGTLELQMQTIYIEREWINKVQLYAQGTIFNILCLTIVEKKMKRNVCICLTESLCCTAEINTTL